MARFKAVEAYCTIVERVVVQWPCENFEPQEGDTVVYVVMGWAEFAPFAVFSKLEGEGGAIGYAQRCRCWGDAGSVYVMVVDEPAE